MKTGRSIKDNELVRLARNESASANGKALVVHSRAAKGKPLIEKKLLASRIRLALKQQGFGVGTPYRSSESHMSALPLRSQSDRRNQNASRRPCQKPDSARYESRDLTDL